MPRSTSLFPLLLLLLPPLASGLGLRAAGGRRPECGPCRPEHRGAVCGSDGRSYPSVCALRLRARYTPRAHPGHLHKARDGPCEFAPMVVIPPRSVHNVTGAQVYLSCEVRAVPTPVITWRKVTQSPEGTQVLEDLPGDHVNIAVQVRGGPSDHEATAWILINPLRKEDEGVYLCHSANAVGEAESHGTVTVMDLSKYKVPRFPAPDDRM
ncbi:insulin-like growth factor-binding protein-like 1 [Herpailurus yagouaroundi]|uniref:insulin-like growth factor-binding protein-like 1 n=1 Tax=Herpailurus yagouaroundi TaxID=1608482 RepID=UPI001AD78CA6|nr:insulin-like growth factor-binding protein-like 1 [Puma yagouaroundi]